MTQQACQLSVKLPQPVEVKDREAEIVKTVKSPLLKQGWIFLELFVPQGRKSKAVAYQPESKIHSASKIVRYTQHITLHGVVIQFLGQPMR